MAMLLIYWVARFNMLDTTGVQTNMLDNTWVTPAGLSKAKCLSGLCLVVSVWCGSGGCWVCSLGFSEVYYEDLNN